MDLKDNLLKDRLFERFDLAECPYCRGAGMLEEESGWCIYVTCLDCGTHTAEFPFNSEEERVVAAEQAVRVWNMGKVISAGVGE